MPKYRFFALLISFWFTSSLQAEDAQPFILLSTLRVSTLEKELKQAAAAGYEIQFAPNEASGGSAGDGFPQAFTEHNQLILEKTGSGESADYLFIKSRGESAANSITFLENDMNDAAARGYRFRPRTLLGLMEKRGSADSSPAPKYRVIQGSSKHLQEETCKASKEGFRFVDIISSVVVMEKPSGAGDAGASSSGSQAKNMACQYLVIGTRTEGSLRKELAAGAANGYAVVAASCPGEIVVMMEKGPADAPATEYLILDSMRVGKVQRDIAEAAAHGFRAIPRAFFSYSGTNVALMEKSPSTTSAYEYLILETQKSKTLQKKMTEVTGQGFRPIAMNGSRTLLLEKNKQN
jgi:hypothetical protein